MLIADLWKLVGRKNSEPVYITPRQTASLKGLIPPYLICWECCLQHASLTGRAALEHWSMLTTVPKIPPQASAPISSCMGDNPDTPSMSLLDIPPKSISTLTSTKYIQKLRDHIRWTDRKADLFQQKEVWHHKHNYNKCSKAVSLRMGDMVLMCHCLQGQKQNPRAGWRTGSMWWNSCPI